MKWNVKVFGSSIENLIYRICFEHLHTFSKLYPIKIYQSSKFYNTVVLFPHLKIKTGKFWHFPQPSIKIKVLDRPIFNYRATYNPNVIPLYGQDKTSLESYFFGQTFSVSVVVCKILTAVLFRI